MNQGRRRGDSVGYQRGSGSLEVEVANLQSEAERVSPILHDAIERIDSLEGTRDNVRGMITLILAGQGLVIALIIWAMNHIQVVQLSTK
jgi:hypothetical protein